MRKPWTDAEDAMVRSSFPNIKTEVLAAQLGRTVRAVYNRAYGMGLKKSDRFLAGHDSGRLTGEEGKNTRFKKGQEPINKGVPISEWMSPEGRARSAKTRFKKGCMSGAAQHNYKPIGSTRIVYGNLERKVTDDPSLYPAKRWVPVHRMVWEKANGSIPKGHLVVFRQGQHTTVEKDITPDRLELVTRAENMKRNSYHTRYPKEVGQLIQLRGALNRKINRRQREKQDDRRA